MRETLLALALVVAGGAVGFFPRMAAARPDSRTCEAAAERAAGHPASPAERLALGKGLLARDCAAQAAEVLGDLHVDAPTFESAYYLGAALEMAGRPGEAFVRYDEAVRLAGNAEDRGRAEGRRTRLTQATVATHGVLTVESEPRGAQCLVAAEDGAVVHLGTTPLRLLLEAGSYVLRFSPPPPGEGEREGEGEGETEPYQIERTVAIEPGENAFMAVTVRRPPPASKAAASEATVAGSPEGRGTVQGDEAPAVAPGAAAPPASPPPAALAPPAARPLPVSPPVAPESSPATSVAPASAVPSPPPAAASLPLPPVPPTGPPPPAAAPPSSAPPPSPLSSGPPVSGARSSGYGAWPYVLAASGLAVVGGGVVLAVSSRETAEEAGSLPNVPETDARYEALAEQARHLAIASWAAYGLGGFLVTAGGALFLHDALFGSP